MAIKVKHEGNVTSRAVAGAIGGQARRNAEDSKALSQMAAQQNMAANRPLGGAHASPVAPGHATAQLGNASAPMLPPPHPPVDPVRAAAVQRAVGDVKNAQEQEMYDYKLSAQQKNEITAINNALEEARKSGRYTPEEMEKLERQADDKRLGIKPLPTPKEEKPTPQIELDSQGREWINNGNKWELVQSLMPQSKESEENKDRRRFVAGLFKEKVPVDKDDETLGDRMLTPAEMQNELKRYDDFMKLINPAPTVPQNTDLNVGPIAQQPANPALDISNVLDPTGVLRGQYTPQPQPVPQPAVPSPTRPAPAPAPAPLPENATPEQRAEYAKKKWAVRK
jgi:hypothetical protein